MTNRAERMAAIMNRTRAAFIDDTTGKIGLLQSLFAQWERGETATDSLVDAAYRSAHGMKGLALTLGYGRIDAACEAALAYILQQEGRVWTADDVRRLRSHVLQVQVAMEASFAAEPSSAKADGSL